MFSNPLYFIGVVNLIFVVGILILLSTNSSSSELKKSFFALHVFCAQRRPYARGVALAVSAPHACICRRYVVTLLSHHAANDDVLLCAPSSVSSDIVRCSTAHFCTCTVGAFHMSSYTYYSIVSQQIWSDAANPPDQQPVEHPSRESCARSSALETTL